MGGHAEQEPHLEVRENVAHSQTVAFRHTQRRLLPAVPLLIPAAGMLWNAQQQD